MDKYGGSNVVLLFFFHLFFWQIVGFFQGSPPNELSLESVVSRGQAHGVDPGEDTWGNGSVTCWATNNVLGRYVATLVDVLDDDDDDDDDEEEEKDEDKDEDEISQLDRNVDLHQMGKNYHESSGTSWVLVPCSDFQMNGVTLVKIVELQPGTITIVRNINGPMFNQNADKKAFRFHFSCAHYTNLTTKKHEKTFTLVYCLFPHNGSLVLFLLDIMVIGKCEPML